MLQTTHNRQQQLKSSREQAFVLWFEEVGIADIPLVGGKNAFLGETIEMEKYSLKRGENALGFDRDSGLVAHLFDKRDADVKEMVQIAIAKAKQNYRKIGICGQAPSDYPEFARFLVEQGIDSLGLNPDSVLKILLEVSSAEGVDLQ